MNPTQCPDQDILGQFLDETLSIEQSETVNAHITCCSDCKQRLARLTADSAEGIDLPLAAFITAARPLPSPDPADVRIPGLQPTEILGRGGMGIVYRVIDPVLRRELALKTILPEFAHSERATRRFCDEARITGQLQHPGIPPVHAMGQTADGRPYLLMKLIKGQTLSDVLFAASTPSLDHESLLGYFEQICQTMAYAHERGVIHRDLKPQNIMLGAFGAVQIMDWGLAKLLPDSSMLKETVLDIADELSTMDLDRNETHTHHGSILGTYAYMPPEQARGQIAQISRRADVFSLGAVLCAILTGAPPYTDDDHQMIRQKAESCDLELALNRLAHCGADAPWIELAAACLAEFPDDRPPSASEISLRVSTIRRNSEARRKQIELELATAHLEQEKAAALVREERRRRKLQMIFGLTAFMLCGLATFSLWSAHELAQERATEKLLTDTRLRTEVATESQKIEEELSAPDSRLPEIRRQLDQTLQKSTAGGIADHAGRFERIASDLRMAELLDEIEELSWLDESLSPDTVPQPIADRIESAFTQYGVSPATDAPKFIAERISGSLIADRLESSLYAWLMSQPVSDEHLIAVLNEL
ncbi:MAG: serine/threonine protein kinase, partial [Planctomycetaceae bacterium]|nr:serine/threonine protein kinase [Planctomycetaceae bacterium]